MLSYPLLVLAQALGLIPIDEERICCALEELTRFVLDLGCGDNVPVRVHGNGVGADVHFWPGVDVVIEDAVALPFQTKRFDCVAMIASLNHIPNREAARTEARRLIRPEGMIVITRIPPRVSWVSHHMRYIYDPDQTERAMKAGEEWRLRKNQVYAMLRRSGFIAITSRSFSSGLNRIYVGFKQNQMPS